MIYNWVDEIPLSRPKRNIARDFSDGGKVWIAILGLRGADILRKRTSSSFMWASNFKFQRLFSNTNLCIIVLMAEVVKHFIPHLVELHNYSAAHSVA